MKIAFTSILLALVTLTARAEHTTTIGEVHLCCQSCVKGVEKSVADIKGVTATIDKDAETVKLTGPDKASVQKAADALVAAGYFGKSSDSTIALDADSKIQAKKVQSLKLEGVHLCCGKCVSTVDKAVRSVDGVKDHTARKNAETFEVTGDFNQKELIEALHKAGLNGKIGK